MPHVTAIMPTIPSRASVAAKVVPRLLAQVSQLYLHLNGHEELPTWARHPKIRPLRHPAGTGPAIRFSTLPKKGQYVLFVDDDLLYPADYVVQSVTALNRLGSGTAIAYHGSAWKRGAPPTFNGGRSILPFYAGCPKDAPITYVGCGTLGLRLPDAARLDLKVPKTFEFEDDVWISSAIARAGLRVFRPSSPKGWIVATPAAYNGLYKAACKDKFEKRNRALTAALALGKWSLST